MSDKHSEDSHASKMTPKQLQQSFIEHVPSFERDDDLTVVTTAESIGGKSSSRRNVNEYPSPSTPHQDRTELNQSFDQEGVEGAKSNIQLDSEFASMSIKDREHSTPVEYITAPRSSLAIAASRQAIDNRAPSSKLQHKTPSSLQSTISTKSSRAEFVAPPPPGFVSPVSLKSGRNAKSPDRVFPNNRDRGFYTDSRVIRRKEVRSNISDQKRRSYDKYNSRGLFENDGLWGMTNDDNASMPSATVVSSNSHSTVSDVTSLGTWKRSKFGRLEDEPSIRGQPKGTQLPSGSFNKFQSMQAPQTDYMKDNSSVSTSYHSLGNQSYYQRGSVNSNAVQSILSSPSALYQTQGMHNNLEATQSSSSNSSSFSDYIDANSGFGLNTSIGQETNATDESSITYSLPPLMSVKKVEQKILPELSTRLSSSGSDESPGPKNYGDAFNALGSSRQTSGGNSPRSKKREWRLRMTRKLADIPVGELNPDELPLTALMNEWAKTKSIQGANMVENLLSRAQAEMRSGNDHPGVQISTKMYTIAIDAWAKSKQGVKAAQRAEEILQYMDEMYKSTKNENLRPTTGIFNAVVNAWAQSKDENAAERCEQILNWMDSLHKNGNADVRSDTYTYNTYLHALAKSGGKRSAVKALEILEKMHKMYCDGHKHVKVETISFNIVINALAKSKEQGAAAEAEKLLQKMHTLHAMGEADVKPNVVSYCAVIDAYAKSKEPDAAEKGDNLLANMIKTYQSDPVKNVDLRPNTHVFNTLINCYSKSSEVDAASKAEEVLITMSSLHDNGVPGIKPDTFSYTAVIDAWAKSGHVGAALRAEALLNRMEAKYMSGEVDLKPSCFTYNAVIHALAKSGEAQAATRAENVLQNMVNRHQAGGTDEMPTTINFNTVLGAWAKSNSGRYGAERAEKVLKWMDELRNSGNADIQPDVISFNACIDAWARSGDKMAAERAEQILQHMDQLYSDRKTSIKADSYSYNTVLNAWAKSGQVGAPQRAERILTIMENKFRNGDKTLKPNTRTYTTVIDTWAKSNERNSAKKAEKILIDMQSQYERTLDNEARPNTATANAVMNSCAFTKVDHEKADALRIAFGVFDWLCSQRDIGPDAYTYTIMLSVCSNLLPRRDKSARFAHAQKLFQKCRDSGFVNDFVLRKLRSTVTEEEYMSLVEYRVNSSARNLPTSWTRNAVKSKPKPKFSSRRKWN